MSESDLPTIPLSELLLLSTEQRLGRIADAAERALTPLGRIAEALETIASTLSCLTEVVESDDGRRLCSLRSHETTPLMLWHQLQVTEGDA
jgi:hypothetical protein